jgi:hypothetical protein
MGLLDGLDLGVPYHWGIVVADLDRAAAAWSAMPGCGTFAVMDFDMAATYRGQASQVVGRLGYAPLGDAGYVELVQPVSGAWTAATWLEERGEGPYHVGYWADDLASVIDGLPVDTVADDDDGPVFTYLDTTAELGVFTELVRGSLRPMLTGFIASAQPAAG